MSDAAAAESTRVLCHTSATPRKTMPLSAEDQIFLILSSRKSPTERNAVQLSAIASQGEVHVVLDVRPSPPCIDAQRGCVCAYSVASLAA